MRETPAPAACACSCADQALTADLSVSPSLETVVIPEPPAFVCAACGASGAPAVQIGAIAICQNCGASLHVDGDGSVRRATAAETTALSPADLKTLRKARGRTR